MTTYIEVPLMTELELVYCHMLSVPKGTYFGGVHVAPNVFGIATIYLQALVYDEDAEPTHRHIHVEPVGHSFDGEFIGAGVLQTKKGTFRFAVIEVNEDDMTEDDMTEEDLGIKTPEVSLDDYRKLFGSDNITITRSEDQAGE